MTPPRRAPARPIALAARVLGVRPGEVGRGLLLFTYLFLVVGSFVVGKAARDALFLYQFSALQLPYVDIGVALIVSVWVAVYIRLGRYFSMRTVLQGSLVFFASNTLLFYYLSSFHDATWVLPVVYIWVGMFGVVAPAQVWTLANYVLTTREAKRLFGFIGSGAITGGIVGGFVVQRTAMRFGTESTLLGMTFALLACTMIVEQLWRRRNLVHSPHEDDEDAGHATSRVGPTGLRESLAVIAESKYLRAIASVICLSSFATAVAAWQFKAVARAAIPDVDRLTAFFGSFTFWAGLASLTLQWLLTSRLLRRLGLGFALFVVPVALTLGSLAFVALGSLAAVIVLRGSDQVLRYSIDRPTVELLYLPVPPERTFQVKSFIDTVVWRLGDGLSGLAIIVFAVLLRWTPVQVTFFNLLLLGGWLAAAWVAQRQYVLNLRESIYNYRLDAERASASVLDKSATDILASQLQAGDPQHILYALSLFSAAHPDTAHPAVRGLLSHDSADVRRAAVHALDAAADSEAAGQIERLLYDRDLAVRTEAMLYVAHHGRVDPLERIEKLGDFEDFSLRSAMVSFLARPGTTQNLDAARMLFDAMIDDPAPRTQREAARLIPMLPERFAPALERLLGRDDPEVVREAIIAAGRVRKRQLLPLILLRLADRALLDEATEALAAYGDRAVGTLRDYLTDPTVPLPIRREIPGVLLRIGTGAAEDALTETLLDGDTALRFRALTALNRLRAAGTGRPLDEALVENALQAEIMGHLRSYQIFGMLNYRIDEREPVAQALRESMTQEVERIFRLIKLLFPSYDLHSAFVGLQSDNRSVHDNSLEFLENVLKPHLRDLLIPLLDSEVSIERRVRLANGTLGTSVESREQAVTVLALSSDPWLQSCAAYAIGVLNLTSLAGELDRWIDSGDPLLRETARQAQAKLRRAAAEG
jgi:ATP:ADP antiporter, AAA family